MSDRSKRILQEQWMHLVWLAVLLCSAALCARCPAVQLGSLWGIPSLAWYWIAIAVPVFHQIAIVLVWRTQLETEWITRRFPKIGFTVNLGLYVIAMMLRMSALLLVAIANRGTLPLPEWFRWLMSGMMLIMLIWLWYSVLVHFTFQRASGADHFFSRYRSMGLVKQGIFRHIKNPMYSFGFFFLWIPAIWLSSTAAVVVSLFSHLYIWVHYFYTEKPDMERIYGETLVSKE